MCIASLWSVIHIAPSAVRQAMPADATQVLYRYVISRFDPNCNESGIVQRILPAVR